MSQSDHQPRSDEPLDERQSALPFGRQCYQANASFSGLLQAAEFIPVRRPYVLPRMGATRTVFRRDIRALEMDGGDSGGHIRTVITGLTDRGLLRPGMAADIAIFDPKQVSDKATFEDPSQYPAGIAYVIVNGTVVIDQGKHTGALPGRVLYGRGKLAAINSKVRN